MTNNTHHDAKRRQRSVSHLGVMIQQQHESLVQQQESVVHTNNEPRSQCCCWSQGSGILERSVCTKSTSKTEAVVSVEFQYLKRVVGTAASTSSTLLQRSISLPCNLNLFHSRRPIMTTRRSSSSTTTLSNPHWLAENNETVSSTLSLDDGFTTSSSDDDDGSDKSARETCSTFHQDMSSNDKIISQELSVPVNTTPTTTKRCPSSSSSVKELLMQHEWSAVEQVCEDFPDLIQMETTMTIQGETCRGLLLHVACIHGGEATPLSTMDALVSAHPASVLMEEQTCRQRLPIHLACLRTTSLGVLRYLVQAAPSSLQHADADGNLPIHYASMCGGTNAMIRYLVDANTSSCAVANYYQKKLPLHMLCARWVDDANPIGIDIVDQMIQAHPQAIVTQDAQGRLPLHIACNMAHPRLDVIQLLLRYKPETILTKDQDKCTPLQLAKKFERPNHPTTNNTSLGLAYLMEVHQYQKQRQTKKAAKRMARRLFHLGKRQPQAQLEEQEQEQELFCYG